MAKRIVTDFHSEDAAKAAVAEFERRFVKKDLPTDLAEKTVAIPGNGERLTRLMIECDFAESGAAATRLIDQGSVRINGDRIKDRWLTIGAAQEPFVLQVGKRKVLRIRPVAGD